MLWFNGQKIGSTLLINGEKVSAIYYLGQRIWQAISKYWRRDDKWRQNQKW